MMQGRRLSVSFLLLAAVVLARRGCLAQNSSVAAQPAASPPPTTLASFPAQTSLRPDLVSGSSAAPVTTADPAQPPPETTVVDDYCSTDGQCTARKGDLYICVGAACVCGPRAFDKAGTCVAKKYLNESCSTSDECQHIDHAVCTSSVCSCDVGYTGGNNVCNLAILSPTSAAVPINRDISGLEQVRYSGDFSVSVGEPFRITCELSEFESVKWQRDGHPIHADDHYQIEMESRDGRVFSHLSVTSAQPVDSGNYKCFTFDSAGYQLYVITGITIKPNYEAEGNYKVLRLNAPELVLECTVTGASVNYTVTWLKNKTALPKDDKFKTVQPNKLTIKKALESDAGIYTCVFTFSNNATASRQEDITVIVPVYVRLPASTNAVEGDTMLLKCQVIGQPTPSVEWQIGNTTLHEDKGRYQLLEYEGVPNAMLQVEDVKMEDRGEYTCLARNPYWNETSATTMVRVKDKLAALWPFLGICAEVFVLCAIILIYEKKRNKTELEESDTDQSPEQKNTPDHGKDSVRQRK